MCLNLRRLLNVPFTIGGSILEAIIGLLLWSSHTYKVKIFRRKYIEKFGKSKKR